MEKTTHRYLVLFATSFFFIFIGAFFNPVLAETPADQNFDSFGETATTGSQIVGDLIFSCNGSGLITITNVQNYRNVLSFGEKSVPGLSGYMIVDDALGWPDTYTTEFKFKAESAFNLNSLYLWTMGPDTGVSIIGYKEGVDGETKAAFVDMKEDCDCGGQTKYTNNLSTIYDDTFQEYGGLISFGSSWDDIDTVVIKNSTGCTLGIDSIDFSNVVDISIGDQVVDEAANNASFTVSLSHAYSSDITVDYTTADNTAKTADGDYDSTSGTVTIPAGSTSAAITVPIKDDSAYENNESFYVKLSNPSIGGFTKNQAECTINDNDKPVIKVSGNHAQISNNDSIPSNVDNTDFGVAFVSSGGITREFTVANTGHLPLSLTDSISIKTPTNAVSSDFTILTPAGITIAPEGTTTFSVKFDPASTGSKTGIVTIPNNDENNNPLVST
ncbi:choice-of-anchor D domain-containing protein [Aminipila terrae]|uniref:Choice-of-anchor D domain-containing protein n=1 Tax=Aminipila terrae TaxID=2697030 RepID=A0A6P1MDW3_9FIRM|nr:choice-of-anchor D domain-containing protein [Aminipila terrae]QHI72840.1 choice-of-anchor D domain-containing protein [Aminipila terrae]